MFNICIMLMSSNLPHENELFIHLCSTARLWDDFTATVLPPSYSTDLFKTQDYSFSSLSSSSPQHPTKEAKHYLKSLPLASQHTTVGMSKFHWFRTAGNIWESCGNSHKNKIGCKNSGSTATPLLIGAPLKWRIINFIIAAYSH